VLQRTRPVTASPINQTGCIPIQVFADAEKNRAPVCTFLFSRMLARRLNPEGRGLYSSAVLLVAALGDSSADIVDKASYKMEVVGVQGTDGLSMPIFARM
jgi:hypothetical protein